MTDLHKFFSLGSRQIHQHINIVTTVNGACIAYFNKCVLFVGFILLRIILAAD